MGTKGLIKISLENLGCAGLYVRAASHRSSLASPPGFASYFHCFTSQDMSKRCLSGPTTVYFSRNSGYLKTNRKRRYGLFGRTSGKHAINFQKLTFLSKIYNFVFKLTRFHKTSNNSKYVLIIAFTSLVVPKKTVLVHKLMPTFLAVKTFIKNLLDS